MAITVERLSDCATMIFNDINPDYWLRSTKSSINNNNDNNNKCCTN